MAICLQYCDLMTATETAKRLEVNIKTVERWNRKHNMELAITIVRRAARNRKKAAKKQAKRK